VKHRRYQHYTWLNRFEVPDQADFVVLFGLYAPNERSGRKGSRSWWQSHTLVFSHAEIGHLMSNVKTRGGKPDKMFGFGFDSADQAYLTRGSETGEHIDYASHLFVRQTANIRAALGDNSGRDR